MCHDAIWISCCGHQTAHPERLRCGLAFPSDKLQEELGLVPLFSDYMGARVAGCTGRGRKGFRLRLDVSSLLHAETQTIAVGPPT